MSKTSTPGQIRRLTKAHKMSFAAVATIGAAALAATLVPAGTADAGTTVAAAPVAWTQAVEGVQAKTVQHLSMQSKLATDAAKLEAAVKAKAAAAAKAKADAEAAAKAKKDREAKAAASRSTVRKPVYANNLDGWIKESLAIMKAHKIPGTYNGLYKNIMRESSGNPRAINNWDINAQNGVPSKGLLQVIKPTFLAYHVPGTPLDQYHPVANIVAAANYAADRYGSIDNVNSAY
ncbi:MULTISPECIES: transglycosylase SLT domain-containing protein [unclassified Streptomyces]|uniref:Transglycosylase SLT domain-containing protein n=1 Tax=Streptomyces sp. R33 TaxID=3238629 RepID=A0AB39YAX4_9ACTN|nr:MULTISPECIES: transglycosylase SLT domain-containing protein [unclassified Streptomyces]KOY50351.1 lytic transglycosylase [Streptomyces sp. XY332]TDU78944.1 transglycosylase-like protein with SLT domain [Streptomyces sp. KS 21]THA30806.1 lytic transglycosylase [Streptomyces sp. A1547]